MSGVITRIFNLRPGDLARGLPMFGYLFLIISSYVMGQAARDSLFLDKFKAEQLPYVDMAVAALVGVVVAFYIRIGKHFSIRNLLVACLIFFAINVAILWWAVHFLLRPWLYPVLYIWIGIFGVLGPAQVWTLANFVWTTREAKRLFGLLGSGAIAGGIFGGFFSAWMATNFGTESVLLVVLLFLVICSGLVVLIWSQRQIGEEPPKHESEQSPANFFQSFKMIRESPHLLAIAALMCLCAVVTTSAGWQLKAIAKSAISQKDALTAFFGTFTGFTGILALVAQLLITTKLLRHFGIGVALLVLPIALIGGSAAVLFSGTLVAAVLLKGSDKVFRYSIDVSAFQLLYLPVPANVKLQVKSFIDTVVSRLGDGIAGFTILIFTSYMQFNARQLSWVNLILLAAWVAAAVFARRQYVVSLNHNIQRAKIRPSQVMVSTLDRSTANILAMKLNSSDPNEILYALDLFEMAQNMQTHSAVRNLLEHPSPHIRRKAVSILNGAEDGSAKHQVAALLHDDNLEVRTEALLYLTRHDNIDPLANIDQLTNYADYSIRSATVAYLARPGEAQNVDAARMILDAMVSESGTPGRRTRAEAARLIGSLPDYFEPQLGVLLEDPEPDVAQNAVKSAGVLRKRRFVPRMIDLLANPEISAEAADALALLGDGIVGTLRDHLADPNVSIDIRREIPQVLFRIGTPAAAAALVDNLLQGDTVLRFRVISGLNKVYELRRNLTLDREVIETVMVAEVMGHYRSYQILGKLKNATDETLKESMSRELERIFRLVKLLFPSIDMQNAYFGIQSTNPSVRSNALEFLDNALNPQLRSLLVPLIDSEVSFQERVRLADRLLGLAVHTHEEAVAVLANSEDPWLKSCAVRWEQKFGVDSLPG